MSTHSEPNPAMRQPMKVISGSFQSLREWWRKGQIQDIPGPDWRLLLGAGALFLVLVIASATTNSYFLQHDNPTQHVAGLEFARGVWGYSGNKAMIMWLLALFDVTLGPNPVHELIVLTALGFLGTMALTDIAFVVLRSRRAALLTALIWLSMPTTLYYLRMHYGYPVALFLISMSLFVRRRFLLAGGVFFLTLASHVSMISVIPVWVGIAVLLGSGPRRLRHMVLVAAPPVLGYLGYEYIALKYTTELWHTARTFWLEMHKLDQLFTIPYQPLTYLWQLYKGANGLPATWAVTLALLVYPFARPRDKRYLDVFYGTAIFLTGFHFYRGSLLNKMVVLRVLASAVPMYALLIAYLVAELGKRLTALPIASSAFRLLLAVSLPWHMAAGLLHNLQCSTTAYPAVHEAFETAAQEDIAVVFFDNTWVGLYYQYVTKARTIIVMRLFGLDDVSPLTLDNAPDNQPAIVVWMDSSRAVEDVVADIQLEHGVNIAPEGPVQYVLHPNKGCIYHITEGWSPPFDTLKAAHPLQDGFRPISESPSTLIWRTTITR